MTPNIRRRIAVSVFLLAAALQLVVAAFVLARVERVQRGEVDLLLGEEVVEVEALLGTPQLGQLIASEESHNTKWNETFFEVRDAAGNVVAASSNVPAGGLGDPLDAEQVERRNGDTFLVWERLHPATRKGHRKIRVAETWIDGGAIRVARSLKGYQRTVWRLRSQLAWGLLGVSILGALGAWAVASHALQPIQAMTREARSLGASLAGEIPRTGTGDELDELARVLNDMLGRIRNEVHRVRRVTADIAHGLRTPLTALRGELELQLEGTAPESGARVAVLLEMLDEMAALVNRLLLLERLESGSYGGGERRERVELDRLARDVVDGMSVVSLERKQELACAAEPVAVFADPAALRHALLNLLDNAQRHTPEGGRIDVRVRALDGFAQLEVEDSGTGLRPDQLERVFERFYSERDGPPGSGLGLPIARAVAEAHGGTLVASCPGGALFTLRIPRVA